MRVLLDECLPHALRRAIVGHMVLTVQQAGWMGKRNGELLKLAETEFDVFITIDNNLIYQQPLANFDLGFIILHAASNKSDDILPLAPLVVDALPRATKGQVIHVPAPSS